MRDLVAESLVRSKAGSDGEPEDRIVVTRGFVAVVDGATDKSGQAAPGPSNGLLAALAIEDVIGRLPHSCTAHVAVSELTAVVRASASAGDQDHPGDPPNASVAIYSASRREVWRVGDCAVLVAGKQCGRDAPLERIAANARAAFLTARLLFGDSVETLRATDPGREMILPLLRAQAAFRNHPTSRFRFGAIDGRPVPHDLIEVFRVPHRTPVVLATDGYPEPRGTLRESEQSLMQSVAADPLRIGDHPATKAVGPDAESFDDRAYVRLET